MFHNNDALALHYRMCHDASIVLYSAKGFSRVGYIHGLVH